MRAIRRAGRREIDRTVIVQIPPFRVGDIGIMRMNETDRQREWGDSVHCVFEYLTVGQKRRFLVIFELKRRCRDTRLPYRLHIVVPFLDPFVGTFPVRCPGV